MEVEFKKDHVRITPEDDVERVYLENLGFGEDGNVLDARRCDTALGFGKKEFDHVRISRKPSGAKKK